MKKQSDLIAVMKYIKSKKLMMVLKITILLFLIFQIKTNAQMQLYKYKIGDFEFVYYGKGYSYLIPHAARCFINSMDYHKNFWDYKSKEVVTVFINDFGDFGNGGAVALPFNYVIESIAPFDYTFDLVPSSERFQWLSNHELTHIVQCEKPARNDLSYRSLFMGKPVNDNSNPLSMIYSYFASPRWYSPRWFHEGIAIFMETWMGGGQGRVLGGYDEMVFRTMVLDSSYFYRIIGLESEGTTIDFQVGANSYLYGTRFVSYLANKYGTDKLKEFYNRDSSSSSFFANQFENVYGKPIFDEWEDWIKWENEFQQSNFTKIRKNKVTENRVITNKILGSVSQQFFDKNLNKIFAAVNYPGELAHITSIDLSSGQMKNIAPVPSPKLYFVTTMTYDQSTNTIFTTENNNFYRDIWSINVITKERKKLIDFARMGYITFNKADYSLWGIRNYNGRSIIARLFPPYNDIQEVYTLPFGQSFYDLNISNDGKYISGTYSYANGKQQLCIFNISELINGNFNRNIIHEFEDNSASNFVFSEDGKYLFGTSYYTGVSNIFRINVETKEINILTNSERGYFRPIPISKDSLMAFEFHSSGMVPVVLKIDTNINVQAIDYLGQLVVKNNPEVKHWIVPPASNVNLDSLGYSETEYNSFNSMKLASAYPIVEGYKEYPSFGWKFNFMDRLGINLFDITTSYSPNTSLPDNERFHFGLNYNYWEWELKAAYNKADFYDIFGPTKRSRAGYFTTLKYHDFIIYNQKPGIFDYFIKAGFYGGLQTLPNSQNVIANAENLYNAIFNLRYNYLRKSLGAIEDEEGYELKLYITDDYVDKSNILQIFGNADYGILLPLRNTTFWIRSSIGKSFGDSSNLFNAFYFGGFGNNYLDMYSIQRYREMESFPGVKINELAGNSFAKATFEINLQPLRFNKLGFLPFYTTYARLSLFSSIISLQDDSFKNNKFLANTGVQVDFELVLFYLLKSYLSFGYAMAYQNSFSPRDEFMISLKF
jgi:hypothetical protein